MINKFAGKVDFFFFKALGKHCVTFFEGFAKPFTSLQHLSRARNG